MGQLLGNIGKVVVKSNDSKEVSTVISNQVIEYLESQIGKLFGKKFYLVMEIQRYIKNDVNDVVAKAITATKKAEVTAKRMPCQ